MSKENSTLQTAELNNNEALQQVAERRSLTRGRGGNANFPTVTNEKPEDSRRILTEVLRWYNLPACKTDEEIQERTRMFFEECAERGERPTVEKYCVALGYCRATVSNWRNGIKCSPSRTEIIKRTFEVLSAYDAGLAVEGKVNPVPYIFRAKNYYGLKDQTDVVVTPNNPLGETVSADMIEEKYLELPEE